MLESTEIIFKCNSTNNQNVRANELKILEKHPSELYFAFGESNENMKKRYYRDLETLEEDFEKLLKLKEDLENPKPKAEPKVEPKPERKMNTFEKKKEDILINRKSKKRML